ncbi:MAG TPA: SusD/RagB family nutrient-binding outer membrane lipoprotein [Longimicrobium sp.]|nr:SusD/RagB family nutrient-binding outer membrane lipoprotein [Longimicrobium sp.]
MRNTTKGLGRAMSAVLLAGSLGACSGFISDVPDNTNLLGDAAAAQLFTTVQVNTYFFNEGQVARITAMWLNQMAGTDRQFATIDQYVIDEEDADVEMGTLYGAGGLQDIRLARTKAETAGLNHLSAILKIHEAFLFGMAASIWGDLPYSTAGTPGTPATLDAQEAVYASVQGLLDQAIATLGGGTTATEEGILAARDMNFGGDAASWIRVANTLKARYYMHWVEAQAAGVPAAGTACGGNCLAKALAAAQSGISSNADNWVGVHTSTSTETNLWYQFSIDRSGYISGGELGVSFLRDRSDPRLTLFYTTGGEGTFEGSRPGTSAGDPGSGGSQLNTGSGGYAEAGADLPIATCAETRLILAEVYFRQGNTALAQQNLREGTRCHLAQLGLESTDAAVAAVLPNPLPAGAALLQEIMRQKYLALFLNMEAFNDYKRNCLADVNAIRAGTSVAGDEIPGRLYYGQTERQANTNIPPPESQPDRNRNDPASCGT